MPFGHYIWKNGTAWLWCLTTCRCFRICGVLLETPNPFLEHLIMQYQSKTPQEAGQSAKNLLKHCFLLQSLPILRCLNSVRHLPLHTNWTPAWKRKRFKNRSDWPLAVLFCTVLVGSQSWLRGFLHTFLKLCKLRFLSNISAARCALCDEWTRTCTCMQTFFLADWLIYDYLVAITIYRQLLARFSIGAPPGYVQQTAQPQEIKNKHARLSPGHALHHLEV